MIELLARPGYASKAVIYVIVGGLAAMAAAHQEGRNTDTSGALRVILTQSDVPKPPSDPVVKLSRFGVAARAVLISVLGVFLMRAAITADPSEAHGSRESLLEIANALQGRWLLAVAAAGLIAYGIDQALHARCRRIAPVV